jgi:ribonuclease HI
VTLHYHIFVDGSCFPNPGKGGYGAILLDAATNTELSRHSGFEAVSTNNRMELKAVVEGLRATPASSSATVYTDSQYVCNAFNQGWLAKWKKQNTLSGRVNEDLWRELDAEAANRSVTFIWVKGHAGNKWNEEADRLAVATRNA